jgi:hypothetical protein
MSHLECTATHSVVDDVYGKVRNELVAPDYAGAAMDSVE